MFFLGVLGSVISWAKGPKYVFLFIGDGMSMPQRMVADEFSRALGKGPLAMNTLAYQAMTRTCSANRIITDSAASATAIACGCKTDNGVLGLTPDGRRVESVAEVAKRCGRRVGVMTTVTIVHATPGGFYAHRKSRGLSYQIARDLVSSGFDFFAGGGVSGKENDTKDPTYAGNAFTLAERAGYRLVSDRAAFDALPNGARVWAHFCDGAMPYAIDGYGDLPSLAEMVKRAIAVLDGPDGFFMMCEGGKVDWTAHANDAATLLREVIATDEAVKVALAFQKAHPADTLVLTTGDHETGGLSMGFAGTGGNFLVSLLTQQKVSAEKFGEDIRRRMAAEPDLAFEAVKPLVTEAFGLLFEERPGTDGRLCLTAEEIRLMEEALADDAKALRRGQREQKAYDAKKRFKFAQTCKKILSKHAGIGWSSGSHTALPTLTTAQGPGAERFTGMLENADIGQRLKALYE